MKRVLFSLMLLAVLVIFAACTSKPTENEAISSNVSKVVLPPSTEPSTIVIVDKNGTVYETGIENKRLANGRTIYQMIQDCIENARNHGDFVSCMAHLTNWLMKNGYITNKEKGILMNIAARADIP